MITDVFLFGVTTHLVPVQILPKLIIMTYSCIPEDCTKIALIGDVLAQFRARPHGNIAVRP